MAPTEFPEADTHLPLAPIDFLVLVLLSECDSHGYAMVRAISEMSEGRIELLPGNFYAQLRRLARGGLIERQERRQATVGGDQRRRYYTITALGRSVAAAESARLKDLIAHVDERGLLVDRLA